MKFFQIAKQKILFFYIKALLMSIILLNDMKGLFCICNIGHIHVSCIFIVH